MIGGKNMDGMELRPVGIVRSAEESTIGIALEGSGAVIEVLPEYAAAMERIDEYSHLWVLSWFHQAKRDVLARTPGKVNPELPRYGVFALRSPMRPNPIALTLVTLELVEGNRLHVRGLDAVNGTPVVDIKPYYEHDIVFSPRTARIVALDREKRKGLLRREALHHHRESCLDLEVGVAMAMIAEEALGKLNDDRIKVEVTGSPCLADVLQGLTRARLANPARFAFNPSADVVAGRWEKEGEGLTITLTGAPTLADSVALGDGELFRVEKYRVTKTPGFNRDIQDNQDSGS